MPATRRRYSLALRALPAVTALCAALALLGESARPYAAEVEAWRAERERRLRSETGWLTLAGLYWLGEGTSRFGSGPDNEVRLPPAAPGQAGTLERTGGQVRYSLAPGVAATLDGQPAPPTGALRSDAEGSPSVLGFGPVTFFVIQRGARQGVRVKDSASATRRAFAGLEWYAVDPAWRVTARFVPQPSGHTVPVPNVLGDVEQLPAPATPSSS